MATTRLSRYLRASRAAVYRALLDPEAVQRWMVPDGADVFHGRFFKLVPDTEVVQLVEFETDDPTMQGSMTITYLLEDAGDGTTLTGVHDNLPPGVLPADNELGGSMSMDKLARQVEPA
ncbi:MAG: SRPBCC domain-containing protein [Euzebyales bacterium]|nr:SRPBCC domain-containing protein [Euzebyales bacterium]MDQ3431072.1 SRPBCC domain-containing protein [Actinomycetota bacterium]